MADYLTTNTKRLKVLQQGPRGTHHMIFRFPEVQSEATMISQARAIVSAMANLCLDGTGWVSAEQAHEGSDVFLPIAWGAPILTTNAGAATNVDEYGRYVNFMGRSTGGSRVAFYLFNVYRATATANNRATVAEVPAIGPVLTAIADVAINLIGVDQNPVVMKNYANTGINDKIAKKSRNLV